MKKGLTGFVLVAALVAVLGWAFWPAPNRPTGDRELIVSSWGGAYQKAQRAAFFEPFAAESRARVVEGSTPDYGKIYEWQRAGNASADVVDVETYFVYQAGPRGALAGIDPNRLPATLAEDAVTPFGVASCTYAEVIAWNQEKTPGAADLGWADFWNTQKYPGPRGMRDLPPTNLEAALMADGVPPDKLYPLDVDRAFRKLDELRGRTRIILWSAGSKPVELLKDGTVTLCTAWNGRIHDARHAGMPLQLSFNQATLDRLWWVIPAHAKNKDLAIDFISFTLRPDRQKVLSEHIPYGPTNADTWKLLGDAEIRELANSPENLKRVVRRDNKWWAENEQVVSDRWRGWKLKLGQ
jgi:putative spermidine/putrescine transport system substrate-binding protein